MLVFFVQRSPETFVTDSAYWARFEQRSGGVLGNARTESGDKNIHKSNLAVARTSEMSEKVPESSITLAEIQGVLKSKIYNIYIISR